MADTVRYLMEQMVPELEDMVKQKYFSREEVKQIVKRRQDFEYLLKRKATLKEDFLRWVGVEPGCQLCPQAAHHSSMEGCDGSSTCSSSARLLLQSCAWLAESSRQAIRSRRQLICSQPAPCLLHNAAVAGLTQQTHM